VSDHRRALVSGELGKRGHRKEGSPDMHL
jgi:hypothetical protein